MCVAEVTHLFNHLSSHDWNVDRIRTKFNSLSRMKPPTGNHTLPASVERSRNIRQLIDRKVHAGDTQEYADEEDTHEMSASGENREAQQQAASSSSNILDLSLFPASQPSSPQSSLLSHSSVSSSSSSDSSARPPQAPQSSSARKRQRLDLNNLSKVIAEAAKTQAQNTTAMAQSTAALQASTMAFQQAFVQQTVIITRILEEMKTQRRE